MEIRKVTWQETIPIRHQVLWPEHPPEFCYVDGDEEGHHFGGFVDDKLVCVASIFIDDDSARLRKFAALEHYQGKGIGSAVLQHILKSLQGSDVTYMWFDARESVAGFYRKFGFEVTSDRFFKGDIPYVKMGKDLV